MNPYDNAMAIMKAIGEFFKFIGRTFKFIGSTAVKACNLFIQLVTNICTSLGIFGISNGILKVTLVCLTGLTTLAVLSLIPDFITYFTCRLSKKYRNLTTIEQKREYTSKHTRFLLRLILSIHNNSLKKKAEKVNKKASKIQKKSAKKLSKKEEKLSKKEAKIAKEIEKTDNVIDESIDEILNNGFVFDDESFVDEEVESEQENIPALPEETVESEQENITAFEEPAPLEQEKQVTSNIKILYSSEVFGKMLRKGVVLDRKLGVTNNPVLIDFSDKPREVFTGHLCDSESGIKVKKYINGELVELALDENTIVSNPHILDSIDDVEALNKLRQKLQLDERYQKNLHSFFNIHDKAMIKVKHK